MNRETSMISILQSAVHSEDSTLGAQGRCGQDLQGKGRPQLFLSAA